MYYFTIILVLCQYSFSLFHLYYTTKLRNKTKNAIKVYFFCCYVVLRLSLFLKNSIIYLYFTISIQKVKNSFKEFYLFAVRRFNKDRFVSLQFFDFLCRIRNLISHR